MTMLERMLCVTLALCVTYRRLMAQPTSGQCSTDDVINRQLVRMEQMITTLQEISQRQMSLIARFVDTQKVSNERQQSLMELMLSRQQAINASQMSLTQQMHCSLLSTDRLKQDSIREDTRCRQSLGGNQTCYRIVREAIKWEAARAYCRSYMDGMDLVSIESADEHAFLAVILGELHGTCTSFHTSGKKDAGGTWKWTATGQPFSFTAWAPGQPDNTGNYCYVWSRFPGWNTWDDYIDGDRCFLCEVSVPSYCRN